MYVFTYMVYIHVHLGAYVYMYVHIHVCVYVSIYRFNMCQLTWSNVCPAREEYLHVQHTKSDTFRKAWATVETKALKNTTGSTDDSASARTTTGDSDKRKKAKLANKAAKGTKAASVDDILLQKAMRLKQKWLTVCGQTQAFVGAVDADPQFAWISAANMEPIRDSQEQLQKDLCINKAVCVDAMACFIRLNT